MITYSLKCLDKMAEDLSYVNLFDIFLGHGERTAIEYKLDNEVRKISFAQMENPVKYVADNLMVKLDGMPKGFVALKLDNCPEWPIIFWGIMMAGFKPFLLDYRHNEQLTQFLLKQAGAVAIISAERENTNSEAISVLAEEVIVCDKRKIYELAKELKAEGSYKERIRAYSWGDEVALCTSGTTNTAKIYTYDGTAIGHQVLSARQTVMENERIMSDREVKNLAFLPLHHIFGFLACYIWYSFFAGALVFASGKAPSALLSTCREHKVTHMLAVPLLVNNIVSGLQRKLAKESKIKQIGFKTMCGISLFVQRISPERGIAFAKKIFRKSVLENLVGTSLEVIICGGGHVLPNSLKVINAIGYYTICGFGMTEVGVSSVDRAYSIKRRRSGCVGVPVDSIEYKLVPSNSTGEAKGNVGELQIRGESVHSGRMVDGIRMPRQVDENGWFKTGDIGRLENGALYIEGRVKEVIINESGENVYPDELEDKFTSLEGINQFTVMGVKKSADSIYENITLVLETSNEINDREYIGRLLEQVNAANSMLPVFKKISSILITKEALPLSNGIKVKRTEIKRQLESDSESMKYIKIK